MAAIASWKDLALELVAQQLVCGNCVRLTLTTTSMAPFLLPGDRLLLATVAVESLVVGDLVAIAARPCPLVHRMVAAPGRRGGQRVVTKGDAGTTFDRQFPPEAILGRVVSVQRNDKVLPLAALSAYYGARILAWLSCCCASAVNGSAPFVRRAMYFLLCRIMHIVSSAVWSIGQRPSGH